MHAYYYIDNVKVVPVDAKSQCNCSRSSNTAPDLVYGGAKLPNELTGRDLVSRTAVYYAFVKRSFHRRRQVLFGPFGRCAEIKPVVDFGSHGAL